MATRKNTKKTAKPSAADAATRARIAVEHVKGAPVAEIARAEGRTRDWVYKHLATDETQAIIRRLVDSELARTHAMFLSALDVIDEALGATKEYFTKEGRVISGGADHYARLNAVAKLTELLKAGRVAPQPTDDKSQHGPVTLDQIEAAIQAHKAAKSDGR